MANCQPGPGEISSTFHGAGTSDPDRMASAPTGQISTQAMQLLQYSNDLSFSPLKVISVLNPRLAKAISALSCLI